MSASSLNSQFHHLPQALFQLSCQLIVYCLVGLCVGCILVKRIPLFPALGLYLYQWSQQDSNVLIFGFIPVNHGDWILGLQARKNFQYIVKAVQLSLHLKGPPQAVEVSLK